LIPHQEVEVLYALAKAALSGALVLAISEATKRNPTWGGLVASLPLVSLLAFTWLWVDTKDASRIAVQAESTFWFVLPSLPMFLVMPWLLRHAIQFWTTLGICCVLTMILYSGMVWMFPQVLRSS
jgi:hypothetical protein